MNRPDTERVWLSLFGAAVRGLSSIDNMADDRKLASEAGKIADASIAEWRKRFPEEKVDRDDG